MRRVACTAASLLLIASLGCRKQQSNETSGVNDTASPSDAAATVAPADTASGTTDFAFEQRQTFAQSLRQQLSDIDRQIQDLSAQAKSRGGAVSDRALTNIRSTRLTVDRSLSRIDAATASDWDQIKQGVSRSLDDLSEAIEAAQPK